LQHIDEQCVEQVEEFGYPREFILHSLEHFDLNDAATCYFLLEKDRISLCGMANSHFR